jgi:hypothetical protein
VLHEQQEIIRMLLGQTPPDQRTLKLQHFAVWPSAHVHDQHWSFH